LIIYKYIIYRTNVFIFAMSVHLEITVINKLFHTVFTLRLYSEIA